MKTVLTITALAFALGAMPAEAKGSKGKHAHAAKIVKPAAVKAPKAK